MLISDYFILFIVGVSVLVLLFIFLSPLKDNKSKGWIDPYEENRDTI